MKAQGEGRVKNIKARSDTPRECTSSNGWNTRHRSNKMNWHRGRRTKRLNITTRSVIGTGKTN